MPVLVTLDFFKQERIDHNKSTVYQNQNKCAWEVAHGSRRACLKSHLVGRRQPLSLLEARAETSPRGEPLVPENKDPPKSPRLLHALPHPRLLGSALACQGAQERLGPDFDIKHHPPSGRPTSSTDKATPSSWALRASPFTWSHDGGSTASWPPRTNGSHWRPTASGRR